MRFLKIFSTLTVLTVFLFGIFAAEDGSVYNDVVRLHILADSDTAEAQMVKLGVRDRVLAEYGEALAAYTSRAEALAAAEKLLPRIQETVNGYLAGCADYTASVTLGDRYFPTKSYGDYTLPCGRYTALCIRLGKAEGKNFFCVLYPPLCVGAASADAKEGEALFLHCGLTASEYRLLRQEKPTYRIRFKLLEWLHPAEETP